MRLPYIYDTAFCNDFGNIKTNHVSCNMTCELKSLLKSLLFGEVRLYLSVTKWSASECKTWLIQQVEAVVQDVAGYFLHSRGCV